MPTRSGSARIDPPTAHGWSLRLPHVVLPLLVLLLGALIWLTRAHDEDEQRAALISDALWMEQNLRFTLDRNVDLLSQLGPDLLGAHSAAPSVEARLRQVLRPESGLVGVIWLNAEGHPAGAMPPLTHPAADRGLVGETRGAVPAESTLRLARALGRPVYGPSYPVAGNDAQFEVHVPVFTNDALAGVVVGLYSLRNLVTRELPWWFSERYRVEVLDAEGTVIAAKSKVAPLSNERQYTLQFDPPGQGLMLRITAYGAETRWVPALLIASILLLGGVLAWSIWQLLRQLARRQAAEAALRGETVFRKAMEDSLLTGLRARDLDGRITYVNPAFCRMTGFSADELVGRAPPMPYWDPARIEEHQALRRQREAGNIPAGGVELQLVRKDGSPLDALLFEAPLIDAQGRQTGWMGSMLDITEQKKVRELARQQEERLAATSRLITMGEMASTLAHELNQPLAAISSYATGCANRLDGDGLTPAELRDVLARIGRQAHRAAEIIRRVHDFVRRSEPKRMPLALDAVLRDALALIEPDARKRGIRLVAELTPNLPPVQADPVMIEQVAINLIRNAIDAMRDTPPERREVRVRTWRDGQRLHVEVADQGPGIPPETAARLFEPFFTTKAEGMGMGLNICRSIAELHQGRLVFEPNPGGGTLFIFTLAIEPA